MGNYLEICCTLLCGQIFLKLDLKHVMDYSNSYVGMIHYLLPKRISLWSNKNLFSYPPKISISFQHKMIDNYHYNIGIEIPKYNSLFYKHYSFCSLYYQILFYGKQEECIMISNSFISKVVFLSIETNSTEKWHCTIFCNNLVQWLCDFYGWWFSWLPMYCFVLLNALVIFLLSISTIHMQ